MTPGFTPYTFLMPGAKIPYQGTGASTVQFDPSTIWNTADGLVPHVARIRIQLVGLLHQGNNAPAIQPGDWDFLLSQTSDGVHFVEGQGVNFTANGETPLQLSMMSLRQIMRGLAGGDSRKASCGFAGPAIGATGSSGARDIPVLLEFIIDFTSIRYHDIWNYIKPQAYWANGQWNFTFADPSVVFDPLISWGEVPQVNCYVDLFMTPAIILCPPFEWRERCNMVTGSTTTQIEPSIFEQLGFYSPAVSGGAGYGCDDIFFRAINLYSTDFPQRFPPNLGAADYGFAAAMHGAPTGPYINRGATATTISTLGSASAFTPLWTAFEQGVTQQILAVAPMVLPSQLSGPHSVSDIPDDLTKLDSNLNVTTVIGGVALTGQHTFYYARALFRAACDDKNLAGVEGDTVKSAVTKVVPCGAGYSDFVQLVPDGRTPSSEKNRSRKTLISWMK